MLAGNNKISATQLKKLIVFDIISISIMIVPEIASTGAGKDGLISILLSSILALIYGFLLLYFSKNVTTNYFSYSSEIVGRFLTFVFGILYMMKLFIFTLFAVNLFSNIINATLLPNTSYKIIVLSLIALSFYLSTKELEVKARLTELLYFVVLIPVVILFLLGIPNVNPSNLLPLFTNSSTNILQTGVYVFLTFSALDFVLFASPFAGKENYGLKKKNMLFAILTITFIHIIIFLTVVGLLGTRGAKQEVWSTITVLQMLEVPGGFIQRLDAIVLMFWLISIFSIIGSLFYYFRYITEGISRNRGGNWCTFLFAVIAFICSIWQIKTELLMNYFSIYLLYLGLPQSILIPLIIMIIANYKSRKAKKGEAI
jgi:spore germination protein (amino acid permease)